MTNQSKLVHNKTQRNIVGNYLIFVIHNISVTASHITVMIEKLKHIYHYTLFTQTQPLTYLLSP